MNDNQITALAREYAEETVSHTRLSTTIANDTEDVIRFLLRRYCLVEKEKLKAIRFRKVYSAEDMRSKFTEECLIDALFPEIAKEVEG